MEIQLTASTEQWETFLANPAINPVAHDIMRIIRNISKELLSEFPYIEDMDQIKRNQGGFLTIESLIQTIQTINEVTEND